MSDTKRDLTSWDSDEELLGETASISFDKDLDKNEDELLGFTDDETSFDTTSNLLRNTPQSDIILNIKSEGSDDDLLNFGDDEENEEPSRSESLDNVIEDGGNRVDVRADASSPETGAFDSFEKFEAKVESPDVKEKTESPGADMKSMEEVQQKIESTENDCEEEELDYQEIDDEEDEDDDDENSHARSRFTSERKNSNMRGTAGRANVADIPDTLELSKEDEKKIEEFVHQKSWHADKRNNARNNNHNHQRRHQKGLDRRPGDLPSILGSPHPGLGLHLLGNGMQATGNVVNTITNMVNIMMMDKLRQRPPVVQSMSSGVVTAGDTRLRAPHTLLPTTSGSAHFLDSQQKFGTGLLQQPHKIGLVQVRAEPCQGIVGRPVLGLIGHQPRHVHPQMIQTIHCRPALTQQVAERPRLVAQMDNQQQQQQQQIQVITQHQQQQQIQTNLHSGLIPSQVHIPAANFSIPPPPHGQMPQPRFVQHQQPMRMVVPMNGFVRFGEPNVPQPSTLVDFGSNNVRPVQAAIPRLPFGQAVSPPSEMVGRPIETVVLGRAANKNKVNRAQNGNMAAKRDAAPNQADRIELEEAEKLARRAARFSKPPVQAPSAVASIKTEAEATSEVVPRKRILSPTRPENPKKIRPVSSSSSSSNRKVIVKNEPMNDASTDNPGVSLSGDGDYKDFELMRGLQEQKMMREMILKRKEESRQLQAQQKKKNNEAAPPEMPKSLLGKAPEASQVTVKTEETTRTEAQNLNPSKPMKKVLMTKSQYKALIQHMKTKGIPLPKAVKEVSTKQQAAASARAGLKLSDGCPARRVVKTSEEGTLKPPPRLVPMPTLIVPDVMPIPTAVANHPRFAKTQRASNVVLLEGLAPSIRHARLRGLAENIGPVKDVKMAVDELKAYVEFQSAWDAQVFAAACNGSTIDYSVVSAIQICDMDK